ncbi:hypothetical protein [Paraglaciecola sp.]|uniref:hypothetical protein n=1 Tax=Paraglaciecola sp. TaxID=1920173 RepID=UPI003EF2D1A3
MLKFICLLSTSFILSCNSKVPSQPPFPQEMPINSQVTHKQYFYDPMQCQTLQHQCGGKYIAWDKDSNRENKNQGNVGHIEHVPKPVGCACQR